MRKYLYITLPSVVIFLLTVSVPLSRADTSPAKTPDLQQLRVKLAELQANIKDLNAQLTKLGAETKASSTAASTPAPNEPAPDPQLIRKKIDQMQQESATLQKQIAALENLGEKPQQQPVKRQPPEEEKQSTPAIPNNTVDIYGFVMTDAEYNFGQINPDWFDVMRPTQLDSSPGQFAPSGNFVFSVRQTRFGVKSSTKTSVGTLKTIFEFELFGVGVDAGQTTFRLRHAWGEIGHFGAGQTWSPFMDPDVFPNQLEYWGPNGMVFFRNIQLRWMPITGESHIWIALERPGASADGGVYANTIELTGVAPRFNWPNLTWQARLARSWGHIQAAGMVARLGWVQTVPAAINLSGSTVGWGVMGSAVTDLPKKSTGRFQVVYGKGIENYMNDANIDVGVQSNFPNLVTPVVGVPLPVLGVVAFFEHNWSERFSSTGGYSLVNIWNSNAQLPSDFHQGSYALGNVLFHPIKAVTMGGEFQFGRRVNFTDGFNVNDYKLQFSFRYDWSKGFEF
jgi:DcaP outer membrane protein